MHDSIEHCLDRQSPLLSRPLLPLRDYVESADVLAQIKMDKKLKESARRLRWTPETMKQMKRQCDAQPLYPDLCPTDCAPNVSYGCVFHLGAPQLWVTAPCHSTILQCHGRSQDVVCGRRGERISVCTCSRTNNVESLKHWVDGNERFYGRERLKRRLERQKLKQEKLLAAAARRQTPAAAGSVARATKR